MVMSLTATFCGICHPGATIRNMIDGNNQSITHSTDFDSYRDHFMRFTLTDEMVSNLDRVVIINRQDCCQNRFVSSEVIFKLGQRVTTISISTIREIYYFNVSTNQNVTLSTTPIESYLNQRYLLEPVSNSVYWVENNQLRPVSWFDYYNAGTPNYVIPLDASLFENQLGLPYTPPTNESFIIIRRNRTNSDNILNLGEIVFLDSAGNVLNLNPTSAFCSNCPWHVNRMLDGNYGSFAHTRDHLGIGDHFMRFSLNASFASSIAQFFIVNRVDCCKHRFVGSEVITNLNQRFVCCS
jgi:hypothetical protein